MRRNYFLVLIIISLALSGCSMYTQISNISRLKFRLKSVSDFTINGLNISNKSSLRDFNVFDSAQLLNSIAKGSLPVKFNLNIEAMNPNDGGGYPRQDLDIVDFKWRLIIDDVETLSGNIARPISVPGKGETTIFPITVDLDLYKFFKERGFENMINLALAIGGKSPNLTRVTLKAQPTIQTPLGKIKYPSEIDIIDREFR
jgi:LEA14-like dessication related protein